MENTTLLKRAVIYIRVSTAEQMNDGNSLVSQRLLCLEYAKRYGYEVVEEFIEKGESAKTANRTELQRLLKYCALKKNNIELVISYKLDRLARFVDDYSFMRVHLRRYGIRMVSITEPFDDTPAGRMMENMLASFAQFDNDNRTERTITGMKQAVSEGRFVWGAPVGYENVRINGKATIAPASSARLVRLAFEEVAQGHRSIPEIWQRMIGKGLKTQKGKPVGRSQFHNMLRNELYAGTITQFGLRLPGTFTPIVSKELFSAVQFVLSERSKKGKHYLSENADFPLRRFVFHPNGAKLTGCWSQGRRKQYAYYFFRKKQGRYPTSVMNDAFKMLLNSVALTQNECDLLKSKLKAHFNRVTEDSTERKKALNREIKEREDNQRLLVEKNLKGVISDSILQQMLATIEKEIGERAQKLLTFPDKREDYAALLSKVETYLTAPGDLWEKTELPLKIRLQRFYFPNGVYFENMQCRTDEYALL